jgi:hypothetical protein
MKKTVIFLMVFAMIGIANATFFTNNGNFESPLGPGSGWNIWQGGGTTAHQWTSGGNPGGYVSLDNSATGWAGWFDINGVGGELKVYGIPAGTTIIFSADMKSISGALGAAGLKMESWNDVPAQISASAEPIFPITTSWASYSITYTIAPNATRLVGSLMNLASDLVPQAAAHIGFDNARITIAGVSTQPALRPIPIVGSGVNPVVTTSLAWENPAPKNPSDTVTATAYLLGTNAPLVKDPNLGPTVFDPGVVALTVDPGQQSASVSLALNKYYYWAVHATDPNSPGSPVTAKGFTWNFQTNDLPPVVTAPANQYLVATASPMTITLNSTVSDDKPGYTIAWTDITAAADKDPATTVVINTPAAEDTTVTLTNATGSVSGYYRFTLTVTDSASQQVVKTPVIVGVYATCKDAAIGNPDDPYNAAGDLNGDCKVNLADFAIFAADWLKCNSLRITCP